MSRHLEKPIPSSIIKVHAWKLNFNEGLIKRAEELLLTGLQLSM
ncbi:MAG: hypothetical protein QW407_03010 [Thermofilaceae archaeon]